MLPTETAVTGSKTRVKTTRCAHGCTNDPATPRDDHLLTELIQLFGQLSDADKGRVLGFASGLATVNQGNPYRRRRTEKTAQDGASPSSDGKSAT